MEFQNEIFELFTKFEESEKSKIFDSTIFGYRKVTIERPLRLDFQVSEERLERLKEQTAFINLAQSKKKDPKQKLTDEEEGKRVQARILEILNGLLKDKFLNREDFEKILEKAFKQTDIKLDAPMRKALLSALSERNDEAPICLLKDGTPEADSELRDTENVPLLEEIQEYFDREVRPHMPDAWINTAILDPKDGKVGRVGYEINFNRYFYVYQPPRPLEEIDAEIKSLQNEINELLGKLS